MAKEMIELEVHDGPKRQIVTAYLHNELIAQYSLQIVTAVWDRVAEKIADMIVKQHGQEIIAKLDMQAIANTTIAQAGNKVAEALRGKW